LIEEAARTAVSEVTMLETRTLLRAAESLDCPDAGLLVTVRGESAAFAALMLFGVVTDERVVHDQGPAVGEELDPILGASEFYFPEQPESPASSENAVEGLVLIPGVQRSDEGFTSLVSRTTDVDVRLVIPMLDDDLVC
jgi:hypothetical protein